MFIRGCCLNLCAFASLREIFSVFCGPWNLCVRFSVRRIYRLAQFAELRLRLIPGR
jgi:hypothetical protein